MKKDMRDLLKWCRGLGWSVDDKRRHLRLIPPFSNMQFLVCPRTPSDVRAIKNTKAAVKREMAKKMNNEPSLARYNK